MIKLSRKLLLAAVAGSALTLAAGTVSARMARATAMVAIATGDRPVHKHALSLPDRRAYGRDWRRGRDTSINVVINSGFAGYPPPPPPPRTVVVREYHAPAPVLVPTPVYAAPGPAPGYYGAGIGGGYRAATPNFGSAVGGALGGFVGAQVGEGSGQLAATAAGAVMGYLIGGQLGQPYR